MNIIEKKISVLVVLGLATVFSFALVSTTQAADLTNASTTSTTNYGGRLTDYAVSFTVATTTTPNETAGRVHLIFPSSFGLPGANGASLATSSISASITATGVVASATVTTDSVILWLADLVSGGLMTGDIAHFTGIGQFLNPYVGGSFTLGIETRSSTNLVEGNASSTAFTIVNAPDNPAQTTIKTTVVPPTSKITSPTTGESITAGQNYVIKGTALDQRIYAVSKVEVSVDNGSTWATAELTKVSDSNFTWEYTWTSPAAGSYTVKSRATDTAGNVESVGVGVSVTVSAAAAAVTPATPVTEMTTSELQTKIAQLQQQLISLLQQYLSLLTQQVQGY